MNVNGDGWSVTDGEPDEWAHAFLACNALVGCMVVILPAFDPSDDDTAEGICLDQESYDGLTAEDLDALTDPDPMRRVSTILDLVDDAYSKLPDAEPWAGDPQ